QDFGKLKDKDADDPIVPPWLKVYWRKAHSDVDYDNDNDPTGGYPLVLKEVLEWMITHQDLKSGNTQASMAPGVEFADRDEDDVSLLGRRLHISPLSATPGTNVRTSGSQTVSRSE